MNKFNKCYNFSTSAYLLNIVEYVLSMHVPYSVQQFTSIFLNVGNLKFYFSYLLLPPCTLFCSQVSLQLNIA